GGGEPLVVRCDRDFEHGPQLLDEPARLRRLLALLAPERERQADDYALRLLGRDQVAQPPKAGLSAGTLNRAQWPGDGPGRVGDGDAGPGQPVVEGEHLQASASATALRPASSAACTPSGFRPPASASVGRPPPPPPMCFPSSRTSCDASRPFSTSESAKLTTTYA